MSAVVIVGVGNIGFRHFQGVCATHSVDRIFILDPSKERVELALHSKDAIGKRVSALRSIEEIRGIGAIDCLISAVTTDVQAKVFDHYIRSNPRFMLLEKPLGQSRAELESLLESAAGNERIYVNCARNLGTGVQKIRKAVSGSRIHLDVSGNNWGLGCNLVHFVELFRYLTDSKKVSAKSAQISPSSFANKRGTQYEEFLGTASFSNEVGDSLQITCGATEPTVSGISVYVKEKSLDQGLFLIQEKPRTLTDLRSPASEPLGDYFVSESTRLILTALFSGANDIAIPTLREAAISHDAYFEALELGLGRSEFKVT